jgi:membrane fusion protein, multidrug efflux system
VSRQARLAVTLLVAALVLAGGAYWLQRGSRAPAPAAAAPPPPEVGFVEVKPAEVPLRPEYAGRVVGLRNVEVRAQVGGVLRERGFQEGTRVKQEQVLFRIEDAPYRVALARANAQLAQAQATQRQAEENFARIEELSRRAVATDKQLDDARAARDQSAAAVQLANAEVEAAKLNLGYTTLAAPVSGSTTLDAPALGSLIQAQQTLLTTITPLDPAYVSFSVTDEEFRNFRTMNEARATPIRSEDLAVTLLFGSTTPYPQQGRIDVSANLVDVSTGTIQIRAAFPNPDGVLLPGQFVRLQISGVTLPNAVVVPKRAVSQGPQGPFVYVVDAGNLAQARPIRLGQDLERVWVVEDGLKGGERVIVDGLIRVRPGAPVKATAAADTPERAAATGAQK